MPRISSRSTGSTPTASRPSPIVQAEDELAAVGMAIGAGWAGARSLTATSGPGISLMAEFVGLAYFAEIPVVIIDVQRMGPSTGLAHPHQPGRHPQAAPAGPRRLPAHRADSRLGRGVLLDDHRGARPGPAVPDPGVRGHRPRPGHEPLAHRARSSTPTKPIQRGKVLTAADLERLGQFERYKDVDGDGVCYRTIPGTEHPLAAYFTRGTGHNEKSGYSERPEDWKKNLDRLALKLETARKAVPRARHRGRPRRPGRPDRLRRHPLRR